MTEHSCDACAWLLAKTTTIPETSCIIVIDARWSRPVNGYAGAGRGYAHRWFYQHVTGLNLDSDIDVRHTCDIRPCINMDHLLHGSRRMNMRDAVDRDRIPFGDRHHWSKLTAALAREVVQACRSGGMTQGEVARLFDIDQATVSRVLHGRIWARDTADLRYVVG